MWHNSGAPFPQCWGEEYNFSYVTSDITSKQKENQQKKEERGCLILNIVVRTGQLWSKEEQEEHPRQGEESMQRPWDGIMCSIFEGE